MYIPKKEISKRDIDSTRKGSRVVTTTPDSRPKIERMIVEIIISTTINIDNTNIKIPKVLASNCFLKISILENRGNLEKNQ